MCRPPTPSDVQEDERNARVALFGTGPVPSPLFLQIGKELPRNLVSCDTGRESGIGAFACGAYKTSAPRRPPTALAADLERLRRVSIFGTRPAVSRTNECVKAELPRNLVSCDHAREPTGAFVCGVYKSSAPLRPPTTRAAEAERHRRVSIFGIRPIASKTNELIKAELPRNLVSCDTAREPIGAFACGALTVSRVVEVEGSGPSKASKSASHGELDALLSSSPKSITALGASTDDLTALAI